ncbi:MAG: hypothetical protein AAFO69_10615 [Bacteroidota bacterium]
MNIKKFSAFKISKEKSASLLGGRNLVFQYRLVGSDGIYFAYLYDNGDVEFYDISGRQVM